jgi:1,4-dihydroxy-2-naphthoyl-CoA hydrolase
MSIIWKYNFTAENITNKYMVGNMIGLLGIECIEVGNNYLIGKMPVDERTKQSAGILHGGANVVLAESIASLAANLCIDGDHFYAVGLEINANHLKSKSSGYVYAKATPFHLGFKTQVWNIEIKDENEVLLCIVRHTVAILPNEFSKNMHFNLPKI